MKCEACGKEGTLDIRATLIRCGFWVESKPPRCMECGGDGKTAQDKPQRCQVCNGSGVEVRL